jgi:hypothetical protein
VTFVAGTAPPVAAPEPRPAAVSPRSVAPRAALAIAAALALAALSLLRPWALAFDPQAWVVWGRDASRLALDTSGGPSWKPLPVVFTTLFSLAGSAAPALWLIVARAGGLLALAGTYALAARLAGRWAGVAAAAAMALSSWWFFNTALGNSEGLLAAVVVWAVVAQLAGRPRAALVLATAAALLRPEAWPFLGLYGLWVWRRHPRERVAVAIAAVVVPLLWFGPDVLGAGGALGASKAARGTASRGSAALADHPVLALLGDTATLFTLPVLVAALLAAVLGDRTMRVLAAGVAAWVAIVAAMTAGGYAGNPRYLVAAAAIACALAGAGVVLAARAVAATARGRGEPDHAARAAATPHAAASPAGRARHGAAHRWAAPLAAAILAGAVLAVSAGTLGDQAGDVGRRAHAWGDLGRVIAAAGGRDALRRCGPIRTTSSGRSLVAYRFDLPLHGLVARPAARGVLIRTKWFYGEPMQPATPTGYRVLASARYFQVVGACG